MQSQVPTSSIPSTQGNSPRVPAQYAPPPYPHSQQGSLQPVQGQRPISLQAQPQTSNPSQPSRPGAQYAQPTQNQHLSPTPHFAGQLAQHTPHHQQQQPHARPISYAGPPQVSHVSQGQAAHQQPERKGRGFFDKMSSTQKLGASLVSGLAPTVLSHQGKEKIGKWGKGKIDSFAGAMGYAPAAAASPPPIGKPQGNPGPRPTGVVDTRPVMYAGPGALGARPVRHVHPGAGRGGGQPPVAPAVLVGAVPGRVLGASLADRPGDSHFASGPVSAANGGGGIYDQPTAQTSNTDVSSVDSAVLGSSTVYMDSAVTYDQVTVADTSYTTLPSTDAAAANSTTIGLDSTVTYEQTTAIDMSVSNANSIGLDSTHSYSADYSCYQGPGDGAVYADTTISSDAIGSGSGYTEPTATYADTYSETTYAEPGYAAESGYTEYASETTYVSETEVYADAGGVAEAATSGGGGGSWLDSLGLGPGSWTDMSNWGGSLDSGDAALALI
ncbi:hypothetical protein AB5N19_13408 [Seiridium cardinale]